MVQQTITIDEAQNSLREFFKRVKETHGVSYDRLAKEIGIDKSYLCHFVGYSKNFGEATEDKAWDVYDKYMKLFNYQEKQLFDSKGNMRADAVLPKPNAAANLDNPLFYIKYIKETYNVSYKWMSEQIGVNKCTFSCWVTGKTKKITKENQAKLAGLAQMLREKYENF